MSKKLTIGLVVPYSTNDVPAEGRQMYPHSNFIALGVGVERLTHSSYEQAMARVLPAAIELAEQNVDAIMVIGTSLTFYRGRRFNAELIDQIVGATGLPASTMSSAVVDGLRKIGASQVAVATAYNDEVNGYLRNFLIDSGFEVLCIEGFGLEGFADPHSKTEKEIVSLSKKVFSQAPEADAVFISCGGLNTLRLTKPLEDEIGVPIVSSMPTGIWAAQRLVGNSGYISGYGRLFERSI